MKRIICSSLFTACCCLLLTVAPSLANAKEGEKPGKKSAETSDAPAMVEVVTFKGQSADNKKIDLYCKVKSNCCYNIIVERSSNGKHFSAITTLSDNK